MTVVGGLVAARYELEALIGGGGTARVYRAHDHRLGRTVAVKLLDASYALDPEYVERFRREARAAAALSHPHLVSVLDQGEVDARPFIVFEHVDGSDLKQLIRRRGAFAIAEALEVALAVARALAVAHSRDLVHRDIKPQNILVGRDGRVRVTDFGIAHDLAAAGLTESGVVVGSSEYIAPEQALGSAVDGRTDVYALGVVLYELLTGRPPFAGASFVEIASRHVTEPPPSLLRARRDCPLRLAHAVERALEKEPARRFPSMEAFAGELALICAELPMSPDEQPTLSLPAAALPAPRRARRRRRRRRRLALTTFVLAAAAAAVAFQAVRGGGASASAPVPLVAVGAYDPFGDDGGQEHDDAVALATDHRQSSYWSTEHYRSFRKPGVGIVLDARRPVELSRLTVVSDTPGFTAEVKGGASPSGPFAVLAADRRVGHTTTFVIPDKTRERYTLVWITRLTGAVHLNEVRGRASASR